MTFKYNDENSVLNTDAWDHRTYNTIYQSAEKFQQNVDKIVVDDSGKFGLIGDVFSALYKSTPMMKSEFAKLKEAAKEQEVEADDLLKQLMTENNISAITGEATPPENPNELLMQKVLENDEYKKMHDVSVGDKLHSSLSTMALGEEIQQWLQQQEKMNEDFKNASNEAKQAQKQLDKLNQQIQERAEQGKQATKGQQQKQADAQQQLEQAQQEMMKQMQKSLSDEQMGDMLAKAKKNADKTKEGTRDLLGGAGDGDNELKKLPLDAQIAVADLVRHDKKVKEIAEMAGKFKAIAKKKQKQKHTETVERNGIGLGDDVERLVAQELAYYRNEGTRLDFLRRFSEKQTVVYSPEGKETLGKGAIVVCLDESGSMHSLNAQSKGFVIALAMIARKQKRDLVVIPFSKHVGDKITCEKGKVTPQHIVDMATKFLGGGTQYVDVLSVAKETIETAKRFKNADIVFVTDGDPWDTNYLQKYVEGEFGDFKKKNNVNVISLLIGNEVSDYYVKQFSDTIIHADNFMSEAAHDVLAL